MTVFPPHIYQGIPMNKLDELPNSITRGLNPQMSMVTYEGLSTQLGKAETPNDLLLPIHQPSNDSGMKFGVMFYNHDHFNDRYEINPHKVNFKKDRDTLCIGKTTYTADIRKYVKDVKMTYTLKLNKGVASPLFVPYVDNVYLVLKPIQDDHFDNPPLILDNDEDDYKGGNRLVDKYKDTKVEPDDYYEYEESLMDSFHEDDTDLYGIKELFTPSKPIHTVLTKEETEAIAFHEVDGQEQQSLVMFNKKNDPKYQAQQDFFKMFPNAGRNMDTFDYESHGMIPPTEDILDLPDSNQTSLTEFEIVIPIGKTSDNDLRYQYQIEDVDESDNLPMEDVYVTFEEIDGEHLTVSKNILLHSEYESLALGGEEEIILERDVAIELSDEEVEIVNIFALPDLKVKPIDDRIYDEYTEMWRRSYGLCKWKTPMPKSMSAQHDAGSKDWFDWAIYDCQCEGSLEWHNLNYIESCGYELTDKACEMIDSRDIFYIKPEPPEELGRELKQWEWDYNIFKTPKPKSLLEQVADHTRHLRDVELSDLSNIMEEYADKNFNHHRHFNEPIVNKLSIITNGDRYTFGNLRSKPDSSTNRRKDDYTPTPKFNFKRVDNQLHITKNARPSVAIKPIIDSHVPLYIRKVI